MAQSTDCSILKCHIRIGKLADFKLDPAADAGGTLFIRCFIFAGGGRRIRLDTAAAAKGSSWDEVVSLESRGAARAMREVLERKVVFELRRRKKPAAASKLLGRAEVAWEDFMVEESGRCRPAERWITFAAASKELRAARPSLSVEMRGELVVEEASEKRKKMRRRAAMEEGFEQWSLTEDDMFLAATLFNPR